MDAEHKAFGLRDVLAVLVITVALIVIGIPAFAHPHRSNRRAMCAINLKGIGTSAKIYANDNNERWMSPPFSHAAIDNEGIDYLAGRRISRNPTNPGEVGYDRELESRSDPRDNAVSSDASTAVSVTRSFWILVRSDAMRVEDFICPSSGDVADSARIPEAFYDFEAYSNISYGYQVPFGPRDTRPREGADSRQPLAADKGPYYLSNFEPRFRNGRRNFVDFNDPLARWRRFNSPNHNGQGQNVLFSSGHVAFEYTPAAGIHGDNIYTLMTSEWDEAGFNLIHGESPHFATVAEFPYPGQGAFGFGPDRFSSTDSLIYP